MKNLKKVPADPIFTVLGNFRKCPVLDKINLVIGIYRSANGKNFVMPSVKKTARKIKVDNFNYISMQGNVEFLKETEKLFFGTRNKTIFASQQTCGGTQAVRLTADLIFRAQGKTKTFIGTPTWDNHFQLFNQHQTIPFDHLNKNGEVDFASYKKALQKAPKKSILILHGGKTHNPTGKNLSLEQLKKLASAINRKKILVLVDFAYFGLGNSISADRKFVKFYTRNFDNFALTISYSKNMTLYRQRTGALFVKVKNLKIKKIVENNLQYAIRGEISNAPDFGAAVVTDILQNNFSTWKKELKKMRQSIEERKKIFLKNLPQKFQHLQKCSGLFGILGLTKKEVLKLQKNNHIFLPDNGRINFASLKTSEIKKITAKIKNSKN